LAFSAKGSGYAQERFSPRVAAADSELCHAAVTHEADGDVNQG
jgi:hypothetical protein